MAPGGQAATASKICEGCARVVLILLLHVGRYTPPWADPIVARAFADRQLPDVPPSDKVSSSGSVHTNITRSMINVECVRFQALSYCHDHAAYLPMRVKRLRSSGLVREFQFLLLLT